MEEKVIKLLLVDDDEDDYLLTKEYLTDIPDKKFEVTWASNFEKGAHEIKYNTFDILIFDFLLGGRNGIDLLITAKQLGCESPIILLTGRGDLKTDMKAMRLGAADYLVKSELDTEKLDRSIRYALERAAASRALKMSEEKYRSIFEKSRDMIYITDERGNFIDFNDSAERIFGYSREELLNVNARELYFNPENRMSFLKAINKTGAVSNYEVTLKHKSGEKRDCLISGTVQRTMSTSGNSLNYLGIIHDITRRKKAEKDLLIAEKLAVTGRVVRTLAHEIRNPLTNINLSLEQLQSEMTNEDLVPYFDIIKRNSKRINDLITDLLHSSKPTEVKTKNYSINDVMEETLQMAIDRLTLKGIKVVKSYCDDPCEVDVDKEKMKIALLNIIINAIEAMPEKEGILELKTISTDNKCIVRIEDNGTGIKREQIGRLFEPYFTSKNNGVGLGLATTHNILQSHNAIIDVESEIGKGTCFTITFELKKINHEV
jgi:PAS domain S-box-containing protein